MFVLTPSSKTTASIYCVSTRLRPTPGPCSFLSEELEALVASAASQLLRSRGKVSAVSWRVSQVAQNGNYGGQDPRKCAGFGF